VSLSKKKSNFEKNAVKVEALQLQLQLQLGFPLAWFAFGLRVYAGLLLIFPLTKPLMPEILYYR
jgi:hypothetical protein